MTWRENVELSATSREHWQILRQIYLLHAPIFYTWYDLSLIVGGHTRSVMSMPWKLIGKLAVKVPFPLNEPKLVVILESILVNSLSAKNTISCLHFSLSLTVINWWIHSLMSKDNCHITCAMIVFFLVTDIWMSSKREQFKRILLLISLWNVIKCKMFHQR